MIQTQQIKQLKYYSKLHKKAQRAKTYSFLTRDEQQLKEEKELDLIKRDSHGFDNESFKYDPYHGKKRKRSDLD